MKKYLFALLVVILVLTVFVSCNQEAKYPLDGKTYHEPTKDASVLEGTYIVAAPIGGSPIFSYGDYYWLCFKSDGTLTATPAWSSYGVLSDDYATGTWSLNGTTMTISVYGKSMTGTKSDVAGAGFAVRVTSNRGLSFAKMSDGQLSKVTKDSIIGTWFKSDDYGNNYGYRFDSDGTCYVYSTDKTSYKTTWMLSTNGTKIRIGDIESNNIALSSGYLHSGASILQKL